ncbi:MAG TPA: SCO1664 family protein [Nocardioidaceae bacterium]|nr:SCO1664 family protein [Nocardioidaceae bacterium]
MDAASTADVHRLLTDGEMTLAGRLLSASNATFVGSVSLDGETAECVYKPVRGERPLWDFPDGTLAHRERAAYLVSEATGWHLVPPTVLRDADFGVGMVQLWIDEPEYAEHEAALVDIVPLGDVPTGYLRVLDAEDQHRRPVSLVHADHVALQQMAALDAVINNADRKGGHVLTRRDGHVHGVDHGVCFHEDPKLRTVLWGWAGEPLPDEVLTGLQEARDALDGELTAELAGLLSVAELTSVRRRLEGLLAGGSFPLPSHEWPAIPWPAF